MTTPTRNKGSSPVYGSGPGMIMRYARMLQHQMKVQWSAALTAAKAHFGP